MFADTSTRSWFGGFRGGPTPDSCQSGGRPGARLPYWHGAAQWRGVNQRMGTGAGVVSGRVVRRGTRCVWCLPHSVTGRESMSAALQTASGSESGSRAAATTGGGSLDGRAGPPRCCRGVHRASGVLDTGRQCHQFVPPLVMSDTVLSSLPRSVTRRVLLSSPSGRSQSRSG